MQVPTKENSTGVCSIRKNSSHGRSLRTGASGVPMGWQPQHPRGITFNGRYYFAHNSINL